MNKLIFVGGFLLLMSVQASGADAGYNIPRDRFPITDEDEINYLKEEAVKQLKQLSESANGVNLELVRVKSADYRSWTFTGTIWTLVAEINENKAPTECTIEIWEKTWRDFVKLDAVCGKEKRSYQWKSREDPDKITTKP